jgi:hypothetical protein
LPPATSVILPGVLRPDASIRQRTVMPRVAVNVMAPPPRVETLGVAGDDGTAHVDSTRP